MILFDTIFQIHHEEQKIRRLQQQLHEQRQAAVGASPDGRLC